MLREILVAIVGMDNVVLRVVMHSGVSSRRFFV